METAQGRYDEFSNAPVGNSMLAAKINQPASIDVAIKALQERVKRLEATVSAAEQRFGVIVRPEPPQAASTAAVDQRPRHAMSQLGSSIEQIAVNVEAACDRLSSLIQRAEV